VLEDWSDQEGIQGPRRLLCAEGGVEQHHKARRQEVSWCWVTWGGHKLGVMQQL